MTEYINSYEHKKDEPSDNEKINFSELDLSKSENIAICSVAIAGALSEAILNDPNSMKERFEAIDLAWRNISVLDDRIASGKIAGVPADDLLDFANIKSDTKRSLQSCGKKIGDSGAFNVMQGQFYGGCGLSEYSAPTVASLLRQATASFADIISDSKIDQGTLNYFAGNIRPNIKNIDQAP